MNLFSYLKSRLAILDVVNHYTTVRKTGQYWKGCCPFHSEKTPSFTVSPDKNIFYCFGCHAGGDVIAFIARIENMSPIEAVHHLAENYSIQFPEGLEKSIKAPANKDEKKHYWHLCQLVAQWCHENLLRSSKGISYFRQRGIDRQTLELFWLGYFPQGMQTIKSLLEYCMPYNYLAHDLVEASIISVGKAQLFSPFEERLIFPIRDHMGRFCGFGGRTFMPNDERSKYYNSKENSFFLKGSLLFGFDLAKQAIQKQEKVLLVEGYTDCIAMVQHGFSNTLATLGTACTIEHLKTIARYAGVVYILYDGDQAGQKAILRLTELCWQVNLDLKVVQLPPDEDPASLLSKGEDFKMLLNNAQDIFSFFIDKLGVDFSQKNFNEKLQATKQLLKIILSIEDPLKQDFLLQNAAKSLDIPLATLKGELLRGQNTLQTATNNASAVILAPISPLLKTISELEKKLFSVIINNIGILQKEDWYLIDYFNEPLRNILLKIQLETDKGVILDFISFFELLTVEQKDLISKLLLEFQEYTHENNFSYLFAQFQKQHWKEIIAVFKIKLAKAEQDGNKNLVQKLLHDFQKFKKRLVLTRGV